MSREVHVRFCERRGVRFPPPTLLLVLCRSRARAEQARRRVAEILATLGLVLHPDKTRIARLTRGQEGVDFLGFHLRKVESWRWRGHYYLQRWPSDRAMAAIRAKIREVTDRRYVGLSVEMVVTNLNRVLRGWGAYFRYGNSARKFTGTSATATRRGSSPSSTATCTSGWPSSQAPSTDSRVATGSAASPGRGAADSGSTVSMGRCGMGLRMPCGERCREAVCGRTACTD